MSDDSKAPTPEQHVTRLQAALTLSNRTSYDRGEKIKRLEARIAQLEDLMREALKCKQAADVEGLAERLQDHTDHERDLEDPGSLRGLLLRRLLPAFDLLATAGVKT